MANGARNSQRLQVQINQLRLAAEDDVKRAKAFDVPGDMGAAQRNLELVLNLRAEGLTKIADQIPRRARPRTDRPRTRSTRSPARCRPSWPPTSSTPSAWRRSSSDGARQERRQGPADRGQPLHDRHLVAGARHRGLAAGPQRERRLANGSSGPAAPGLHGHGLAEHERRRRHAAARGARAWSTACRGRPTRPSPSSSPTRATTTSPTSRSPSRSSATTGKAITVDQDDRPDQVQGDGRP